MTDHDPLCPAYGESRDSKSCRCAMISAARSSERHRMSTEAATAMVTTDREGFTLTVDDPNEIGWVPVSVEVLKDAFDRIYRMDHLRKRVLHLRDNWLADKDHDEATKQARIDGVDAVLGMIDGSGE